MKLTPRIIVVNIASGETETGEVDLGSARLTHIFTPAALTGTALSVYASIAPGGTFSQVYDDQGDSVTITVAPSRCVALPASQRDYLEGLRVIKLKSGTTEAAARTLLLQVN